MREHSRPGRYDDIGFDISPDNKFLAFNGKGKGGRDLYLLDLKTWKVSQLTNTLDYEGRPCFSPDGKSVVYAVGIQGDRADHLMLCSIDTKKTQQLTAEDYNDSNPVFSPDGSKIAFCRNLTYNWGGLAASWGNEQVLFVMNVDGSKLSRLTPDNLYAYEPQFSRDGKNILFPNIVVKDNLRTELYWVNTNGDRLLRKLPLSGNIDSTIYALSPDKKELTFLRNHSSGFQLYIMDSSGSSIRQLATIKEQVVGLRFSPTGEKIYYLTDDWSNGLSLWIIDKKGKNTHPSADLQLFENPMNWKH